MDVQISKLRLNLMVAVILVAASGPAVAASRWKPVSTPALVNAGPMLLARLNVQGRNYALYRDMQTQGYLFATKGRREPIGDSLARAIRSDVVNLAWKIEYQAKLAKQIRGSCQKTAALVVVPATDDLVQICSVERSYLRDAQALSGRIDKLLARKVARR